LKFRIFITYLTVTTLIASFSIASYASSLEFYHYRSSGINEDLKYLFEKVFQEFASDKYYTNVVATNNYYFPSFGEIKAIPLNENLSNANYVVIPKSDLKNYESVLNNTCFSLYKEIGFDGYDYLIYKNECKK